MSIARVTEISSTSEKSFENAIEEGVLRAAKTLRGIKGAWVKEQEVKVDKDKIVQGYSKDHLYSRRLGLSWLSVYVQ